MTIGIKESIDFSNDLLIEIKIRDLKKSDWYALEKALDRIRGIIAREHVESNLPPPPEY